jgi:hypothetical protein
MPRSDKLLAWVNPHVDGEFLASFVGGGATKRPPATQLCNSPDAARQWIEQQAATFRVSIEWLSAAPEN